MISLVKINYGKHINQVKFHSLQHDSHSMQHTVLKQNKSYEKEREGKFFLELSSDVNQFDSMLKHEISLRLPLQRENGVRSGVV